MLKSSDIPRIMRHQTEVFSTETFPIGLEILMSTF